MSGVNKILVLFVHPAVHKSRINYRMLKAIEGMEHITIVRLYDEYPDFHINIKREQDRLVEHDIVVWHHPFYWYSAPSMLKEWIDLVLEHGFAYGRKGMALKGKKVMSALSTGGRFEAYKEGGYNNFSIDQFMAPYKQTVQLCRMEYLPPFVIHGTHLLSETEITSCAEDYRKILVSLRDGLLNYDELHSYGYINDLLK